MKNNRNSSILTIRTGNQNNILTYYNTFHVFQPLNYDKNAQQRMCICKFHLNFNKIGFRNFKLTPLNITSFLATTCKPTKNGSKNV